MDLTEGILSTYNPYTYRGYRFDSDIGMYYLNSRYYNPQIGRFLNTDGIIGAAGDILSTNMYAYCANNPVMFIDPSGNLAFFITMAIIGLVVGGGIGLGIGLNNGHTGWNLVKDIGLGALIGAVSGAFLGALASVAFTGAIASSGNMVWLGCKAFAWAYCMGGPGAALGYVINNFFRWISGNNLAGYYPPNGGFDYTYETTLNPGTVIQRYGSLDGTYASPYATDPLSLSLPFEKIGTTPSYFVVDQSVTVVAGPASPWFGQYGGGTQYQFNQSIRDLLDVILRPQ